MLRAASARQNARALLKPGEKRLSPAHVGVSSLPMNPTPKQFSLTRSPSQKQIPIRQFWLSGLRWSRLALAGTLFLTTGIAHAGNMYSYIGKDIMQPNNWFLPSNWTGGPTGTIPGADDTATIGYKDPGGNYTAFAVRAAGTASVKNLTISHQSSLAFTTLNVTGIFSLGDVPSASVSLTCIASPGTLTLTGTTTVSGISGNSGATLSGDCIVENFGTVNLGRLFFSSGAGGIAVFNNMSVGIVNMSDGSFTSFNHFTFNNLGFLRKPSSPGMASVNVVTFVNSGTVEVGAGTLTIGGTDSILTSNGGRFNTLVPGVVIAYASPWTINDGTRFTGPGLHRCTGTMDLHGNVTIGFRDPMTQLVTPGNFELPGLGTLNGPGNLHVIANSSQHSSLNWTGGTLRGTGALDIDAGGFFNISGSSTSGFDSKYLGERTINNSGTTTWTGTTDVFGVGSVAGVTFNNLAGGLFEISNDRSFSGSFGTVFNNRLGAIFRKILGTQVTTFNLIFNNDGLEDVQTGVLQLAGGGTSTGTFNAAAFAETAFAGGGSGTYYMNAGTAFTGDGLVLGANATVTLNATVPAVNYALLLGTLNGAGDLNISNDFDMGLDSGGATLAGSGAVNIAPRATLNFTGSQQKTIVQRRINNAGTAVWVGVGNIVMSQGAVFNNEAGARFYANNNASFLSGGGTTPQFINAGTFIKSTGTGTTTFDGADFNNSGFVNVLSGTLKFGRPYTQTAGTLNLNGGHVTSTSNPLNIQGGSVVGAGTITGAINNTGGTIGPGHSPGILNETGNYAQSAGGTLAIQLGGTNAATPDFDQLIVTGSATLAGTLQVTLDSGFAPATGAQFQILSATSRTGTFATLTVPAGISVNYSNTGVFLAVTGAVPVQILSPNLSAGTFNFGFNTITGRSYTVQSTTNLTNPNWILFTNFTGNGSLKQLALSVTSAAQRFFRVSNP